MKKRVFVALALALIWIALPVMSALAGAVTFHFSFKGQDAFAFFESFDSSGCIGTFVGVSAVDGSVKTGPGQPAVESSAFMFIDQFDFCTGISLISAFGSNPLVADEFQIDKNLNSATLNTAIVVCCDSSGTSFLVPVGVNWTGTGDPFRQKNHFQIKTPGFKLNFRFDGTFRNAEASGSVSVGGTNLTPDPAVFAQMGSVKQGEVAIVH